MRRCLVFGILVKWWQHDQKILLRALLSFLADTGSGRTAIARIEKGRPPGAHREHLCRAVAVIRLFRDAGESALPGGRRFWLPVLAIHRRLTLRAR